MDKYYLGVDASKGYSDFVILNSSKETVKPNFQLDDTFNGHSKLYNILENFSIDNPNCIIYTAIESTGGYENNWFHFFLNCSDCFNLKISRLNPYGVSKNSQADLKRNKTDKISARDVAEYMITHAEKVTYQNCSNALEPYKEQWKFINLLNKQKVQLLNRLEKDLYKTNTELIPYCKTGVPQWVLRLISKYPTSKLLSQASIEQVASIRYISLKKANKLIEQAKTSIASASDDLRADRIKKLGNAILEKEIEINYEKTQIEQNISKIIKSNQIQLLKSFDGIGPSSAVGLSIIIGDINNYKSSKHVASFLGIHPVYKQSGDGTWGFHMSKKGDAVARQILYMVALSAIRINPLIQELYQKNFSKGMKGKAALGVCMHKIIRIIYGMLKNNTMYDSQIDQKNREKSNTTIQIARANRNRRHQNYDNKAPVSGRQHKKRKENEQKINGKYVHNKVKFLVETYSLN